MKDSTRQVRIHVREYLKRGWQCIPLRTRSKSPSRKDWPKLRITEADIESTFSASDNVGIVLGEASGWLVDVDLDCKEAIELAGQFLPPTPAVTGRPSAPGSHRWYVAAGARTEKHTDPKTRQMIVELRSTGAQTAVGPSIHPDGELYEVLNDNPTVVPAPMLAACVRALAEAVVARRTPAESARIEPRRPSRQMSSDIEQRAIAYLNAMPPAISGQNGHGQTFAAAVALVHGFAMQPEQAIGLLQTYYNPRCDPPWSESELRHKVDDASTKTHNKPYGWLRDTTTQDDSEVDLSQFQVNVDVKANKTPGVKNLNPDPGPLPADMLRIPGFVSEVMDHCLATAPYPNHALAFCGALALHATLAGRKVRDEADNRTNIYLLALAYSAVGKDWPRKVNTNILHRAGMVNSLGEKFASSEGLQDSLFLTPTMLFQTDEVDGLLQSINKARDARHENILGSLLTIYSVSNSIYPMRRKAGREAAGVIDQPCLVIFGTAIPTHYYQALSERMLTNGFFARMLIVESGPRSAGQDPGMINPPPRVLETAKWWSEFNPGSGNLETWHPEPLVVEATSEARGLLADSRVAAEMEYASAELRTDPVGTTVWGRVPEQVRKLALLHAVSANYQRPQIDATAVRWATAFVSHQTRRMLFMANNHSAENPFHADCLKLLEKLREAPDRQLVHSVLLKRMKIDTKTFQNLIVTLEQQGDLTTLTQTTTGRPARVYQLSNAADIR